MSGAPGLAGRTGVVCPMVRLVDCRPLGTLLWVEVVVALTGPLAVEEPRRALAGLAEAVVASALLGPPAVAGLAV